MRRFSPELCERAIGVVLDWEREVSSQREPIGSIASKIGCSRETLRRWVREGERDAGRWPGPAGDERERIRTPEREVRQANGILRKALAYFARAELDRPHKR